MLTSLWPAHIKWLIYLDVVYLWNNVSDPIIFDNRTPSCRTEANRTPSSRGRSKIGPGDDPKSRMLSCCTIERARSTVKCCARRKCWATNFMQKSYPALFFVTFPLSKSASNLSVCWIVVQKYMWSYLHFLLTLKPKAHETAQKT